MSFSHVNIEFVKANSMLGLCLPWITFDDSINLTLCSNCIIAFAKIHQVSNVKFFFNLLLA